MRDAGNIRRYLAGVVVCASLTVICGCGGGARAISTHASRADTAKAEHATGRTKAANKACPQGLVAMPVTHPGERSCVDVGTEIKQMTELLKRLCHGEGMVVDPGAGTITCAKRDHARG